MKKAEAIQSLDEYRTEWEQKKERIKKEVKLEGTKDPETGKSYKFDPKTHQIINEDGTLKSEAETNEILDKAISDFYEGKK